MEVSLVNRFLNVSNGPVVVRVGSQQFKKLDLLYLVDKVVQAIQQYSVGPGSVVAVDAKSQLLSFVSQVAISKFGATYFPTSGLNADLQVAATNIFNVSVVISEKADGSFHVSRNARGKPPQVVLDETCAYIMATSGSTGTPKFACISRSTFVSVINGLSQEYAPEESCTFLGFAPTTFSSSLRQLWVPLTRGHSLQLAQGGNFDADLAWEILAKGNCFVDITPSHLHALIGSASRKPRVGQNTNLVVSSEPFTGSLLRSAKSTLGQDTRVFHLFGMTETGGSISALEVSDFCAYDGPLPLAEAFHPFYMGLSGSQADELVVSGLSGGDMVFSSIGDQILPPDGKIGTYRAGDLFSKTDCGYLLYKGRTARQFKFNGKSVSPQIIEAELEGRLGTDVVRVVAVREEGVTRCAGIFVAGIQLDVQAQNQILSYMKEVVPGLPIIPIVLDSFPLLSSGKIDLNALGIMASLKHENHKKEGEGSIYKIWSHYLSLSLDELSKNLSRSFFELGGDSLSAIQMIAEVNEITANKITLAQFLDQPTLQALEKRVAATKTGPPSHSQGSTNVIHRNCPVMPQQRMAVSEMILADSDKYWISMTLEVWPALEKRSVTRAVEVLLSQVDIFRFSMFWEDGMLRSSWNRTGGPDSILFSLPDQSTEFYKSCFCLDDMPLVRFGFEHRKEKSFLTIRGHHAVLDRQSLQSLLSLWVHYIGNEVGANNYDLSYRKFMNRLMVSTNEWHLAAEFWRDLLSPHEVGPSLIIGDTVSSISNIPLTAVASGKSSVSWHSFWLYCYCTALWQFDPNFGGVIGIDIDMRGVSDTGLIGLCSQAVPLPIFGQSLDEVQKTVGSVLEHRQTVFDPAGFELTSLTNDPLQPFFGHKLVFEPTSFCPKLPNGRHGRVIASPSGINENRTTLFVRRSTNGWTLRSSSIDSSMRCDNMDHLLQLVSSAAISLATNLR